MRAFADQIRPCVPRRSVCIGTDGFGRSDYRIALRKFFEVDRHYVAVAALKALADESTFPKQKVADAIAKYGIDEKDRRHGRCEGHWRASKRSRFRSQRCSDSRQS